MKLKYSIQTGLVVLAATMAGVSCTDTWDDHYSVSVGSTSGISLWENLQQDESLRPFVRVLDSCGYGRVLSSNQVYTVWAPAITEQKAQQWIAAYRAEEAAGVLTDENRTVHQFIRNHIAMYSQQISSLTDDTVSMLNGKRMHLTPTQLNDEVNMLGEGVPSSNGMLYKVDAPVTFFPNIWEMIQEEATGGDDGLDSVYNYFTLWNREVLDVEASVPGEIKDGRQEYLDSVMIRYNEYFSNVNGYINREDSLYWFLAPTNKVWRENVERYEQYFDYHDDRAEEGDSLRYNNAVNMLLGASFYNVRYQPGNSFNADDPDSICSVFYNSFYPGYYMFERPFDGGGILNGLNHSECSNGRLYTTPEWRVPDTKTSFMRTIKVEAEVSDNYSAVMLDADTPEDSARMIVTVVESNGLFPVSGVLGGNPSYIVVSDRQTPDRQNRPEITFHIPNTLSNCPYTIKVVCATPLAGDINNVDDALLKRRISAWINYYESTSGTLKANPDALEADVEVDATKMDTITVGENVVFPVCNYGEDNPKVELTLRSIQRTTPSGYAKPLLIDCIIFEPHPEAASADEN